MTSYGISLYDSCFSFLFLATWGKTFSTGQSPFFSSFLPSSPLFQLPRGRKVTYSFSNQSSGQLIGKATTKETMNHLKSSKNQQKGHNYIQIRSQPRNVPILRQLRIECKIKSKTKIDPKKEQFLIGRCRNPSKVKCPIHLNCGHTMIIWMRKLVEKLFMLEIKF